MVKGNVQNIESRHFQLYSGQFPKLGSAMICNEFDYSRAGGGDQSTAVAVAGKFLNSPGGRRRAFYTSRF
jgi:hypothetical protein